MESDDRKPKPELRLELKLIRPPKKEKKKKGVWQRILEVLEEEVKKGREEESRDPSDW